MRYGKVGHLDRGRIMQQQFDIASTPLDEMPKTNFHQKRSSNSFELWDDKLSSGKESKLT